MSYAVTNEQLKDHFKDALLDAEALVKATADLSGERLSEIRVKSKESLRIAKAKLHEAQEAVMTSARGAANATDTFVHESPWEAIGLAAGVGILVGVLIARR